MKTDLLSRRSTLRRFGPIAAITIVVVAALFPFVILGRAFYWGDLYLYFYPMQDFVQRSLQQGRIPLWNPYINCGQPLVGNPQSWVFYPGSILLYFLPVWVFFTVNAVLHLIAAGWGTYIFLRRIRHDRIAAVLGAIVYSGSGFVIARLQFPNMAQATAYLPWLLLICDRMIERPGVALAGMLAVAIALTILAAHAQIAYMSLVCAALFAIARLYQMNRRSGQIRQKLGWFIGAFTLGIGATAIQILPAMQLVLLSSRQNLPWFEANRFSLEPQHLLNFVVPGIYGHPRNGDFWDRGNFWETCVYVGIIPIALALFAVWKARSKPAAAFFGILALVSLLLAMGRSGGLFWIAYYAIPGVSSFHDPARFVFITTFCLAVLSAIGMRLLQDRGMRTGVAFFLVGLTAFDLAWFSSRVNPSIPAIAITKAPAPPAGAFGGRVYSYSQRDTWDRFVSYKDYGPETPGYIAQMTSAMIPNAMQSFRIPEASGYEPVPLQTITDFDRLVRQALWQRSEMVTEYLAKLDATTVASPADYRSQLAPGIRAPGWRQWQILPSDERFLFAPSFMRADTGPEALAQFSSPGINSAVIEGTAALLPGRGTPNDLTISDVSADSVKVRNTAKEPRLLVRSAAHYPGWQAEIDGIPAQILRADYALQATLIPPGNHSVRFNYAPEVFRIGAYISLVCLGIIAFCLTIGWRIRHSTFVIRHSKDLRHNV